MSRQVYYNKGHWLTICDVCGQRFDNIDMQKRWDGLMVCKKDWEPRQPQDFVRAKVDIQSLPWTRPESTDYTYIAVYGSPYAVIKEISAFLVDSTVTLDGTSSFSPLGGAITFTWSLVSIPTGSLTTLSSTTGSIVTFVPDLPGTYEVSLIVNDGL